MSSDYEKAVSAPESASTPQPTLQAFRDHLRGIVRRNWEGRTFYNPEDIKRWMGLRSATTGGQSRSNLAKLLDEVQTEGNLFRRAREDELTNLPILFAILLDDRIKHGHLIHCFKKHIADDSRLMFDEHFDRLRDILMEEKEMKVPVKTLLEDFKKVRPEYCPMIIGIFKDVHLIDGAILPFCKRVPINKKGGTANVEQYMVQEDLVAEKLRVELEGSRKRVDGFGECYSIAVKSYNPTETDAYRLEVDAFEALSEIPGVIKFLGEYNRRRTFRGSPSLAHHIILEFGEHDLDEFLADNFPPILYTEIKGFWNSLFKVADTLERLHESQYDERTLSGWHGDIKPDNILRVNGEFKLADFGFTQFKVRSDRDPDPKTHLDGLTKSFGAPEIRTTGQGDGYTQKIDTWSFGCVLSSVATWVILGQQAYDHYPEIRTAAIKELKEKRKTDQSIHAPDADDAFHDGVNVLPAVSQWHDLLRNSIRKSDSISGRIIDLIEEGMLVGDVKKRFKVKEMHQKLRDVLSSAEADHQAALESADPHHALKRLSPQMLKVLLSLDKESPASPTTAGEARSTPLTKQGPATGQGGSLSVTNRNDRVRKSERLDKNVRAKVAFREQALMSELRIEESIIVGDEQEASHQASVPGQINKPAGQRKGKQPTTPSIRITNTVTEATPIFPPATENQQTDTKPPQLLVEKRHKPQTGMPATPSIYREYDELEKQYRKFSVRVGLSSPVKDRQLEKHIHNRDIKFVVDNARTMSDKWGQVEIVLLVLAMKIGRLDKDGIDLVYTIGEHGKLKNVKGTDIHGRFKKSMGDVGNSINHTDRTSMRQTLGTIFSEYLENPGKRMTLIILTDGAWEGSRTDNDVEQLIVDFVGKLEQQRGSMEQRWFSIQFVWFGEEDTAAISRLKSLDDNMKERFHIEDIIDSKPWYHEPTDELIRGSIEEGVDEEDGATATGHQAPSLPGSTLGHNLADIQKRPSSSSLKGSISSKKKFPFFYK
ncbi:hypothetical protein KVR01_013574 [Diaporthe batatas]|uniref:uncharacterized protein n=1 Tax=Diaporthe batatas TaxID=748121 RepID=UPI001D059BC3|nr:uncharacterized protein KVR01_013574 [Diaporthe batatas]KAG8156623.1 hypothetical protein KVR01_013574 [Diaporthe batatas]